MAEKVKCDATEDETINNMKTKRLPLPDLLKGFAVFLIVPVHILELFIDYPGRESVFGKTLLFLGGPIAVPVFMVVMGYFMAKNKKSLSENLLRGIKVFVVGLLLNIGLNFNLLLKIWFSDWPYNPLEYIFGVDILYLAGLSILVISVLKLLKKQEAIFALIFAVLVLLLTAFMNQKLMVPERNYIFPFIAGAWSWSYFPLFPWLAYPLIGFIFFFCEEKIMHFFSSQKILSSILLSAIGILILSFAKPGFESTIKLESYYHHTFLYSLWALGIIILWSLFLRFLLQRFPATLPGNFLIWLGKNITLFYVIQWLIIGNIATEIYQTQTIESYIFWFAGIFITTVLITRLLEKTKIKLA